MRIFLAAAVLLALCGPIVHAAEPSPLPGYSPERSKQERDWEEKFRALPDPAVILASMKRLSARPHHLGSAYDKANAEWILGQFKEWGLDAHIETFDVLFPTPKARAVELVAPERFIAKLQEAPIDVDPTTGQTDEQLPPYNMGSIDGDVTAPLVYVNFGTPADYEQLDRLGISVKGAIAIARYGGSWRGIKPKVAAEHGAVGCLIYSDPHEDGYFQGDTYPKGAWRPADGVQRGSVLDMPLYPGDPLTPGIGAVPGARRLSISDAKTITRIPVLPLSYGDARPLLAALGGPVAPDAWRGALPITYHLGPGPARVHLKIASSWDTVRLYDVIGKIPGAVEPETWILRGNHHDAWVNGAQDPIAGQTALLEEARSLGKLHREGWNPRRTILFCAWDGEEEGLFGSTEWVEEHGDELDKHAAVYINSDGNDRGYLEAGGSHTLEHFINDVARDVSDPETKVSVWKRLQLSRIRSSPEDRAEARSRADLRIGALGSGSDYSPFLDHLGVASLNLGFGGEGGGGIYHSAYDDLYWYTHFGDADFAYGRTLAQTAGSAVMRLADAELLPFDFTSLSDTIKRYVDELQKLLNSSREEIAERNKEIEEGVFTAAVDPKKKYVAPAVELVPPFLNFAPLLNSSERLSKSADRYARAIGQARESGLWDHLPFAELDRRLIESERRLTSRAGLPDRPWYRHEIYAPGFYTGYGVKTIPGVREAIEQKQWKRAEEQIAVVARILDDEAALIDESAAIVEASLPAKHS